MNGSKDEIIAFESYSCYFRVKTIDLPDLSKIIVIISVDSVARELIVYEQMNVEPK